jgi:hypothetical protein
MSGGTSFWLNPPRHSRVFFDVVKKPSRLRSIMNRFLSNEGEDKT